MMNIHPPIVDHNVCKVTAQTCQLTKTNERDTSLESNLCVKDIIITQFEHIYRYYGEYMYMYMLCTYCNQLSWIYIVSQSIHLNAKFNGCVRARHPLRCDAIPRYLFTNQRNSHQIHFSWICILAMCFIIYIWEVGMWHLAKKKNGRRANYVAWFLENPFFLTQSFWQ